MSRGSSTLALSSLVLLLRATAAAEPPASSSAAESNPLETRVEAAREVSTGPVEEPEGISRLLATGDIGTGGVAAWDISQVLTQVDTEVLKVEEAISYHSGTRLVLRLRLGGLKSAEPWRVTEVKLRNAQGEVLPATVWQPEPLQPGERGALIVEAKVGKGKGHGAFTLVLYEDWGARTVALEGLIFPDPPRKVLPPPSGRVDPSVGGGPR